MGSAPSSSRAIPSTNRVRAASSAASGDGVDGCARDRRLGEVEVLLLLGRREDEADRLGVERVLDLSDVCRGRLLVQSQTVLVVPLGLVEVLFLELVQSLRDVDAEEPACQLAGGVAVLDRELVQGEPQDPVEQRPSQRGQLPQDDRRSA